MMKRAAASLKQSQTDFNGANNTFALISPDNGPHIHPLHARVQAVQFFKIKQIYYLKSKA